jgi:hypothetical protein
LSRAPAPGHLPHRGRYDGCASRAGRGGRPEPHHRDPGADGRRDAFGERSRPSHAHAAPSRCARRDLSSVASLARTSDHRRRAPARCGHDRPGDVDRAFRTALGAAGHRPDHARNRSPPRLRRRCHSGDHAGGLRAARARPPHQGGAAGPPTRRRRSGPRMSVPGLWTATRLVRRPSRSPLGRRWRDLARQPRAALPAITERSTAASASR